MTNLIALNEVKIEAWQCIRSNRKVILSIRIFIRSNREIILSKRKSIRCNFLALFFASFYIKKVINGMMIRS